MVREIDLDRAPDAERSAGLDDDGVLRDEGVTLRIADAALLATALQTYLIA